MKTCDRGEGHPERDTRGRKADRAQGLGHRLRKSQTQTLPLSHSWVLILLSMTLSWPNTSLEPTGVGAFSSATRVTSQFRRWLSSYPLGGITRMGYGGFAPNAASPLPDSIVRPRLPGKC